MSAGTSAAVILRPWEGPTAAHLAGRPRPWLGSWISPDRGLIACIDASGGLHFTTPASARRFAPAMLRETRFRDGAWFALDGGPHYAFASLTESNDLFLFEFHGRSDEALASVGGTDPTEIAAERGADGVSFNVQALPGSRYYYARVTASEFAPEAAQSKSLLSTVGATANGTMIMRLGDTNTFYAMSLSRNADSSVTSLSFKPSDISSAISSLEPDTALVDIAMAVDCLFCLTESGMLRTPLKHSPFRSTHT